MTNSSGPMSNMPMWSATASGSGSAATAFSTSDDNAQILPAPLPGAAGRTGQRLGIAAGHQPLRKGRSTVPCFQPNTRLESAFHHGAEKAARVSRLLRLRQRLQLRDLHAPRQRLGDCRQQQEMGRTGEEKAPGAPVSVHGTLDGGEQLRNPLHFVQSDFVRHAGDESGRIRHGGLVVVVLIQAEVGSIRRQLPGERRLAALPRAEQADHRGVVQRLLDNRRQRAGKQGCVSGHMPVTIASNCRSGGRLIVCFTSGRFTVDVASDCRWSSRGRPNPPATLPATPLPTSARAVGTLDEDVLTIARYRFVLRPLAGGGPLRPCHRTAAARRVRSHQSASARVSTAPLSMRVQPVVPGYGSEHTIRTPSASRSRSWK